MGKASECIFCPVLEGVCRILRDEKCLEMVHKLREGEVDVQTFIDLMRRRHPERKIDRALRKIRKKKRGA